MSVPRILRRRTAVAVAAVTAAGLAVATAATANAAPQHLSTNKPERVSVQLLSFNDYHGHLEPDPDRDSRGNVLADGNVTNEDGTPVPAGGVEYLATHLDQLRQGHENSLTVAAGDLIGGSTFLSGVFHDEPSVESLNALDLDVSSVGNHEFDEGVTELLRMQTGGCHPVDGCYFEDEPYSGADFQWLAANVVNDETGETPLPPYWTKDVDGVPVGFIGMTLEGTDALVAPSGIRGWSFQDEADTANKVAQVLHKQGVKAIVVLLHEGGTQTGSGILSYRGCQGISGPIVDIVQRFSPKIDTVITGHTHQPYVCDIPDENGPRYVTSAYSYGRLISEINFEINKNSRDIIRTSVTATNHIVTRDVPKDSVETGIIAKWKAISDEVGGVIVGETTAPIARAKTSSGTEDRGRESDLGNMVADAQLWATQGNGAQIAFMNPGGLRADFDAGDVTYAEAFNVQPFSNILQTLPMTGAQVVRALEQQCQPGVSSRPFLHLGVSQGFTYTLDRTISGSGSAQACTSVSVTDVKINNVPLDPAATYVVTVNNFLADGGDKFFAFAETPASERIGGGIDLDELVNYFAENSPVAPPGTARVAELFTTAG